MSNSGALFSANPLGNPPSSSIGSTTVPTPKKSKTALWRGRTVSVNPSSGKMVESELIKTATQQLTPSNKNQPINNSFTAQSPTSVNLDTLLDDMIERDALFELEGADSSEFQKLQNSIEKRLEKLQEEIGAENYLKMEQQLTTSANNPSFNQVKKASYLYKRLSNLRKNPSSKNEKISKTTEAFTKIINTLKDPNPNLKNTVLEILIRDTEDFKSEKTSKSFFNKLSFSKKDYKSDIFEELINLKQPSGKNDLFSGSSILENAQKLNQQDPDHFVENIISITKKIDTFLKEIKESLVEDYKTLITSEGAIKEDLFTRLSKNEGWLLQNFPNEFLSLNNELAVSRGRTQIEVAKELLIYSDFAASIEKKNIPSHFEKTTDSFLSLSSFDAIIGKKDREVASDSTFRADLPRIAFVIGNQRLNPRMQDYGSNQSNQDEAIKTLENYLKQHNLESQLPFFLSFLHQGLMDTTFKTVLLKAKLEAPETWNLDQSGGSISLFVEGEKISITASKNFKLGIGNSESSFETTNTFIFDAKDLKKEGFPRLNSIKRTENVKEISPNSETVL